MERVKNHMGYLIWNLSYSHTNLRTSGHKTCMSLVYKWGWALLFWKGYSLTRLEQSDHSAHSQSHSHHFCGQYSYQRPENNWKPDAKGHSNTLLPLRVWQAEEMVSPSSAPVKCWHSKWQWFLYLWSVSYYIQWAWSFLMVMSYAPRSTR